MNVTLSSDELMYLFELALRHPMPDSKAAEKLLQRLKEPILNCLEKEEGRRSKEAYATWISSESKRLKDLDAKNVVLKKAPDIKNVTPPYVGEGI